MLEVIVVVMFENANAVEGGRKWELLRPFVYGLQDILHGLKLAVHENVENFGFTYILWLHMDKFEICVMNF